MSPPSIPRFLQTGLHHRRRPSESSVCVWPPFRLRPLSSASSPITIHPSLQIVPKPSNLSTSLCPSLSFYSIIVLPCAPCAPYTPPTPTGLDDATIDRFVRRSASNCLTPVIPCQWQLDRRITTHPVAALAAQTNNPPQPDRPHPLDERTCSLCRSSCHCPSQATLTDRFDRPTITTSRPHPPSVTAATPSV